MTERFALSEPGSIRDSSQAFTSYCTSTFTTRDDGQETWQEHGEECHTHAGSVTDLEEYRPRTVMWCANHYTPPPPPESRLLVYRWLQWNFFSTYGWLFTIVFLANAVALVPFAILAYLGRVGVTYSSTMSAASINLLISICMRHEHLVNLLFRLSTSVPKTAPLWVRKRVARVYSYGGLHSGCAIAAVFWYMAFVALTVYHNLKASESDQLLLSFVLVNLVLLLTIVVFSLPTFRRRMHNWFETTHRFAGWASVGLFWAQMIHMASTNHQDLISKQPELDSSLGQVIVTTPGFWCLTIVTLCIVYPWTRLRRHDVIAEPLSDHAVRLHFSYASVEFGQAIRLGTNPLRETHAFAAIAAKPQPPTVADLPWTGSRHYGTNQFTLCAACQQPVLPRRESSRGFSVVVSNAGDWTSRIIRSPPSHLWVRGTPTYGVVRVAALFAPVLVIATGSGIGPCLSLFRGAPHLRCRVLWCARSPAATYGEAIMRDVRRADPGAWIVDTAAEGGRPDLVRLGCRLFREGACEAVVLVSNQAVTRRVMYGLECRGLPTFAPIFDS